LKEADECIKNSPENWTKGWVRKIDALYALGK